MTAFHQQWRLDVGLRTGGLLLCGLAWVAIAHLAALHLRPHAAGVFAYALATIGFLSASAGSAMTVLGRHLFDEITVSQRWRHRPVRPDAALFRDTPAPIVAEDAHAPARRRPAHVGDA